MSELERLNQLEKITLIKIIDSIEDDALLIISLVLILPFMQPIPLPGVSSLLGIMIFLQGLALVIWDKPFIPERFHHTQISHDKFKLVIKAAEKFSHLSSKLTSLKHPWIKSKPSRILGGIGVMVSAGFLSLPLPIPFSNFIPALSIFFIIVALLEEDVILLIMGLSISAAIMSMGILSYVFLIDQLKHYF
jgi:hypothetical protein